MLHSPVTADLALMRELNQALILNLVRQEGYISRAEIAKRTNLSRSTVSNIINELIEAERVQEVEKGQSRGGRRPIILRINYRSHCVIGVELATTFVNVIVTDLNADVLYECREPFDIAVGPDAATAHVAGMVDRALATVGVERSRVAGVGIGIPGPIAYATGKTIVPPIMPGWSGVSLRDRFRDALHLPVRVDNDANLGALAEHCWGAAQNVRNVAYLYLGTTGIGAGLILEGAIYRGEIGSAGEIGHTTIDEHGPRCSCGSYGCLESLAGLPWILRRAETLSGKARSLDELIYAVEHGDEAVRAVFVDAARHLGVAVASLLNLYNPGLVVLGGQLAAAGNLLLDTVRTTAQTRALPITLEHCDIVTGTLGDNDVALGAASDIIQQVFSPPTLDSLIGQPAPASVSLS